MHARLSFFLALLWLVTPMAWAAPVTYLVEVDTTAVQGIDGYLDFQFNGNSVASLDASVLIASFATDAALDVVSQADGSASGVLPGPLVIDNTGHFNAILQGITFGSFLEFDLTIDGDAVNNPVPGSDTSEFFLALLDTSFTPLLTTDIRGNVAIVEVLDSGSTMISTFDADSFGTPPVATVTPIATPAPLPTSPALVALALLLLLRFRRHTAHTSHR